MTEVMAECLRVLKPGAHGLVWALPRTSHWTATALEDVGFEIRDIVHHHFGSGFPKSLNVSKAIDRAAGVEREVVGLSPYSRNRQEPSFKADDSPAHGYVGRPEGSRLETAPTTEAARQWQGWGTALKPATEHWILVRKPLSEPNVATNVLAHGTGALNIDGCRIAVHHNDDVHAKNPHTNGGFGHGAATVYGTSAGADGYDAGKGRWPANLVLSHAERCRPVGTRTVRSDGHYANGRGQDGAITTGLRGADASGDSYVGTETVEAWECVENCPVAEMDQQSGTLSSGFMAAGTQCEGIGYQGGLGDQVRSDTYGDAGGASRFFYVAKASRRERDAGLPPGQRNRHPTVKPIALMRYLCRLVTPSGGVVLDPFLGSGTTGIAAVLEGFGFIGIERDAESVRTAIARIQHWSRIGSPAPRSRRAVPARGRRPQPPDVLVEMLPLFEWSA